MMHDEERPELGQPGWYVGTDDEPCLYRLIEKVHRGGEGEVWRCSRSMSEEDTYWAVKITLGSRVERYDDETLKEALNRWQKLWDKTIDTTGSLHDVNGIVRATRVFQGPAPSSDGRPAHGAERILCLVTPWVDGQDLQDWQRASRHGPEEIFDVIVRMCEVVDQLADRKQVHRDISPRNVMLRSDGEVVLIDFAFMRPAGARVTHIVTNRGFTAPDGENTPAKDRYSVGAVAFQLLTDSPPPRAAVTETARRTLISHGYSQELAEHLAQALHSDPEQRPARLKPWALRLRELGRVPRAERSYVDAALTATAEGLTELNVAGTTVARGRISPSLHPSLSTDHGAPQDCMSLAASRRGTGDVTVFAVAGQGTVWARTDGAWQRVTGVRAEGVIRGAASGDGGVSVFFRDIAGDLTSVTAAADAGLTTMRYPFVVHRVFNATEGPAGRPILLAESETGQLMCGEPAHLVPVGLRGIVAADVSVNRWGELICLAACQGNRLAYSETIRGQWDQPDWLRAPAEADSVSCAAHRTGHTLAIAADTGIWVHDSTTADWINVWADPASRVVLGCGPGWRLQLTGLSGRQVVFTEETMAGEWPQAMPVR